MSIDESKYYQIISDYYSGQSGYVGHNTSGTLKCVESSSAAGTFQIRRLSDGWYSIKLRDEERYCCAANEGHVTLNRKSIRTWERFKFNLQPDKTYLIQCKRDNKNWYTKGDGAIHHKDHVTRYYLVPLDAMKFEKMEWRFLQILENGGSKDVTLSVKITTGVTVKETDSNTLTSTISAEVKKGAYALKTKLSHEWAHAIENTSEKKLEQTINLTVPPRKRLKVYQGMMLATVGNFPTTFGLYSWKTEEEGI